MRSPRIWVPCSGGGSAPGLDETGVPYPRWRDTHAVRGENSPVKFLGHDSARPCRTWRSTLDSVAITSFVICWSRRSAVRYRPPNVQWLLKGPRSAPVNVSILLEGSAPLGSSPAQAAPRRRAADRLCARAGTMSRPPAPISHTPALARPSSAGQLSKRVRQRAGSYSELSRRGRRAPPLRFWVSFCAASSCHRASYCGCLCG